MENSSGEILRINLTTKEFYEESASKYKKRFLGGRGIGAWILFNELDKNTNPLDPDSIIIFSAGALSGTKFPGSSRLNIESKSCMTNGINWSNIGGFLSSELSHTRWDHIVIKGKSDTPVFLYLNNNKVEIRDATHIWGADIWETEDVIKHELSDPDVKIATIGVAGERLVPMSIIITNRTRAAGSGGVGAIMGSKNLKAIAIRGNLERKIVNVKKFNSICEKLSVKLRNSKMVKGVRENGTLGNFIVPVNNVCAYPYRNTQDDHYKNIENSSIAWSKWEKTSELWDSCFECPIECGRYFMEADNDPYKGLKVPMPENNTFYAFATRLDMSDPSYILKAFEMISRFGLDNDAIAVVMSWAFECFEKGILTKNDTDGLNLTWGNNSAVIALIRKIAYKEGFGNLLGMGCKKASSIIGKNSEYYCTSIKGQDNLDALRACKGWALGNVVSLRGGRHLDGAPATELDDDIKNTPELSQKLFGVNSAYIPNSYDHKGKLVSWFSHFKAAIDSLGICYYTSWWSSPDHFGPDEYANALSAMIGKKLSGKELLEIGERIHNVEKAFNTLHAGFTRKDDYPPSIFFDEPIKSGQFKGEKLIKSKYDKMLNEYYEENKWDKLSGLQNEKYLYKLDLPEVVEKLKKESNIL